MAEIGNLRLTILVYLRPVWDNFETVLWSFSDDFENILEIFLDSFETISDSFGQLLTYWEYCQIPLWILNFSWTELELTLFSPHHKNNNK